MKRIDRVRLRAMALLVGLNAAFAVGAAEVFWIELRVERVAVAPGSPGHRYRFNGMLKVYGSKNERGTTFGGLRRESPLLADATIWVDGSGTWDAATKRAEERLRFGGSEKGTLLTQLRCDENPWQRATPCAVVVGAVYNSKVEQSYDWPGIMHARRLPLTQSATPATAKSFPTEWRSTNISGGVSAPTQQ